MLNANSNMQDGLESGEIVDMDPFAPVDGQINNLIAPGTEQLYMMNQNS